MNTSATDLTNAADRCDAADEAVRSARLVRDSAEDAYKLACRLYKDAREAASAANKAYFHTANGVVGK